MNELILAFIAAHWGTLASLALGAVLTKGYVDQAHAKLKAEIDKDVPAGNVRDMLDRLDDVAFDSVKWAMQTMVDPLKASGKWDANVASVIEAAAARKFEEILGDDGVAEAKAVLSLKGPEWSAKIQADLLSALSTVKQDTAPSANDSMAESVAAVANQFIAQQKIIEQHRIEDRAAAQKQAEEYAKEREAMRAKYPNGIPMFVDHDESHAGTAAPLAAVPTPTPEVKS